MENTTFNLMVAHTSGNLLVAEKNFVTPLRKFVEHIAKTHRIFTIPTSYLIENMN